MSASQSIEALCEDTPVSLVCGDGVILRGHLWRSAGGSVGQVIINPATGVLARYYHRYARFLAEHGFDVLTYDYRGIGGSRPEKLRGCGYHWRDWGLLDFDAALVFMLAQRRGKGPLAVVGHSFGGAMPGLAENASAIDRMLTVGAQYAWLGDYAPRRRLSLVAKWHLVMPLVTAICGYFPGKRLGWLEDLPAGVANEWSFQGPEFGSGLLREERPAFIARMATVTAPILALAVSDDDLGTLPAVQRTLRYYTGSPRTTVLLRPADYEIEAIGHFNLFREEHGAGFWTETLEWLEDGINPWPNGVIDQHPPRHDSGIPTFER